MSKVKVTLSLIGIALAGALFLTFRAGVNVPAPDVGQGVSRATVTAPAVSASSTTATPVSRPPAAAATSSKPLVGRPQFKSGPITETFDGGFKILVNQGNVRVITIGPDTVLRRYAEDGVNFEPMEVSDLVPGLRVRVNGTSLADGGTLAKTVTTGTAASSGSAGSVSL